MSKAKNWRYSEQFCMAESIFYRIMVRFEACQQMFLFSYSTNTKALKLNYEMI